jgi:hypothetical protein
MENSKPQEEIVEPKDEMDKLPSEGKIETMKSDNAPIRMLSSIPTLFKTNPGFTYGDSLSLVVKDEFKVKSFKTREEFVINIARAARMIADAYTGIYSGFDGELNRDSRPKRIMQLSRYDFNPLDHMAVLRRTDAGELYETILNEMLEGEADRKPIPYTLSSIRFRDKFQAPMFHADYEMFIAGHSLSMSRLSSIDKYLGYVSLLDQMSGERLPPMIDWIDEVDYFYASSGSTAFESAMRTYRPVQDWHFESMRSMCSKLEITNLDNTDSLTRWFRANKINAGQYNDIPIEGSTLIQGAPVREMTDLVAIFLSNRNFIADVHVPEEFSISSMVSIFCIPMMVPSCVLSISSIRRMFWYLSVHLLMRMNFVLRRWQGNRRIIYDASTYDQPSPFRRIVEVAIGKNAIEGFKSPSGQIEYDISTDIRHTEIENGKDEHRRGQQNAETFLTYLLEYFNGFSRNDTLGGIIHEGYDNDWVDGTPMPYTPDRKLHAWGNLAAPWTDVYSNHPDALSVKVSQFRRLVSAFEVIVQDRYLSPNYRGRGNATAEAIVEGLIFVRQRLDSIMGVSYRWATSIRRLTMHPMAAVIKDSDRPASERARPKPINLLTFGLMAMNANFQGINRSVITSESIQSGWAMMTAWDDFARGLRRIDTTVRRLSSKQLITDPGIYESNTSSERMDMLMDIAFDFKSNALTSISSLVRDQSSREKFRWAKSVSRDSDSEPFEIALEWILSESNLFGWTPMCGMKWNLRKDERVVTRSYTTRPSPLVSGLGLNDPTNSISTFYSYSNIGRVNNKQIVFEFVSENGTMRDPRTVISEINAYEESNPNSPFYVLVNPTVLFQLQRFRLLNDIYELQDRLILTVPCPLVAGEQPIMVNGLEEVFQNVIMNHVGPTVAVETREIQEILFNDKKLSRSSHLFIPFSFVDRIWPEQRTMGREYPINLGVGTYVINRESNEIEDDDEESIATMRNRDLIVPTKVNVITIPSLQKY